jgi:hypothetical protein
MRNAKALLGVALIAVTLMGTTMLIVAGPSDGAAPQKALNSHWRFHDGHWGYWYEPDNRWYYTDGTNWFYNNNDVWDVYPFDKGFGREAFERGTYRVPERGGIAVPRHGVWHK